VNFGVDGPYNTLAASDPNYNPGDAFAAAIYDQRGLYFDGSNTPIAPETAPNPVPAAAYATRTSSSVPWILSVVGVPEPSSFVLLAGGLALGAAVWLRPGRRVTR
jgi:hypothetical protein